MRKVVLFGFFFLLLVGCSSFDLLLLLFFFLLKGVILVEEVKVELGKVMILYLKYCLDNGLIVIFLLDDFDFLVYVDVIYYVGFVCEEIGKLGFVYFFEYMMF